VSSISKAAKQVVVLDNSAAIAMLAPDEQDSSYTRELLLQTDRIRFIVPVLWRYEFANALRMLQKRNRMAEHDFEQLFEDLEALEIEVSSDAQEPSTLRNISLQHDVTAYDAAYLELALRRNVAMATCDKQLKAAATAASIEII
jgi:predicted nucleic acid-binding protein